jgi:hypothetical protein
LQHRDGVKYASFSPDSQRVVTASEDRTAQVWDAATGKRIGPPLRHNDEVLTAVFSPKDGRRIVTVCRDNTARVWDSGPVNLTPLAPSRRGWDHFRMRSSREMARVVATRAKARLYSLRRTNGRPKALLIAQLLSASKRSSQRPGASDTRAVETIWKTLNWRRQILFDFLGEILLA